MRSLRFLLAVNSLTSLLTKSYDIVYIIKGFLAYRASYFFIHFKILECLKTIRIEIRLCQAYLIDIAVLFLVYSSSVLKKIKKKINWTDFFPQTFLEVIQVFLFLTFLCLCVIFSRGLQQGWHFFAGKKESYRPRMKCKERIKTWLCSFIRDVTLRRL